MIEGILTALVAFFLVLGIPQLVRTFGLESF